MTLLPFAEALATVLTHASALPQPASETVPLAAAANRILAVPVIAPRDQPPFDRSTRDGFALRSADIANPLTLIGQLRAGESWQHTPLAPNEAIEIMTGAPIPPGADAVVMTEHTTLDGKILHIAPNGDKARTLRPGDNIVPRGAEARTGATLLPAGRTLHAAEIAIAASCGSPALQVFERPRVAIIATGDELVELAALGTESDLAPAQIYNSNTYALRALAESEGAIARGLKIARDNREDLHARLDDAAWHDLLLLSGGVSMGKFDLVEEALTEFGAEFFFTGALIQPGKPIVFGRLPKRGGVAHPGDLAFSGEQSGQQSGQRSGELPGQWSGEWTYFFGLPGNPVSTQVCFHLFVAPLLRALTGSTALAPTFVEARLEHDVQSGPNVLRFLPAELTGTAEAVTVRLVGWQGSGDLSANARANSYCVLPIATDLAQGDTVRVLLR